MPCALTTTGLVLLGFSAPFVNADRACDIGQAPHSPPHFRISLPPGYRLEREAGIDTTVWRIWKTRGLDIHYDAGDLPVAPGTPPPPPVSAWDRRCDWQTEDGPLGLVRAVAETAVVCSRGRRRDGREYPAQVKVWFPDNAEFVTVVKSERDLNEMMSIALTYTPGDYDRTLFPSGVTVERAIASGWNVRTCGPHLMEDAIEWDAVDVIRVLAKAGVDVNGVNSRDRPFLYQADDENAVDIIQALFDSGARSVATVDGKPQPPVWMAMGAATTLNLFLDHGLDPNAAGDRGITLLMRAAEACQTTNVKNLIARGANLESTNADGDNALIIATREGCLDVVSELVKRGARKDVVDRTGRTPFMIATEGLAAGEAFIAKYRDTPLPSIFAVAGITVASVQRRQQADLAIAALVKRP